MIIYKKIVFRKFILYKRAGADIIFSYFANEVAKWLKK